MSCTDDDLKRLKEISLIDKRPSEISETTLDNEFLRALIARLEAAEQVCAHGALKRQCRNCELIEQLNKLVADAERTEAQLKAADDLAIAVRDYLEADGYANWKPKMRMDERLIAYEKARGK